MKNFDTMFITSKIDIKKDQIYYIKKYNGLIRVIDSGANHIITTGLCSYIEDSKTTITRQVLKVFKFLELNPVEIIESKLHEYDSLEKTVVYQELEVVVN